MIGKLKGIIDSVEEDYLILDVNGVGYQVFCSGKTIGNFGRAGEAASFVIETHVREDHIHLYGFPNEEERHWFKLLQTVQGIGARVAMGILSALATNQLENAIAAQDKAVFKSVSGVGPKLAERIIIELKDKVGAIPKVVNISAGKAAVSKESGVKSDAISALASLGIARVDAFVAVNKVANDDMKLEEIITAALKEVSR